MKQAPPNKLVIVCVETGDVLRDFEGLGSVKSGEACVDVTAKLDRYPVRLAMPLPGTFAFVGEVFRAD